MEACLPAAGSSPLSGTTMKKVLVIVGPTASGKSALAVDLALKLGGEIISADSRQVYKGLDIGTGKITQDEMHGVPHHLLDIADPDQIFTASDFKREALLSLRYIDTANKLPIIVGGTGFYIDTLTGQINLPDVPPDPELRNKLEEKNAEELYQMLIQKDPLRAESIDPHNKTRIIRSLEIIEALGEVPSGQPARSTNYEFVFIGLKLDQETLDQKIKSRLEERLDSGMIREVENLHVGGLSFERMDSLGLEYRYISLYLQGQMSREEMIKKLYTEIRHYAKRQMTWFKRNQKIKWFDPEDRETILTYASESIR